MSAITLEEGDQLITSSSNSTWYVTAGNIQDFVDRLLSGYEADDGLAGRPPRIPILVGAGVSASAGIPLSSKLLEYAEASTYDELFEKIGDSVQKEPGYEGYRKEILRKKLVKAGIPRALPGDDKRSPTPNLGNYLVAHLLLNRLLGPVVSLNVDSLLEIAVRQLAGHEWRQIRFVRNDSEFSDLLDVNKETVIEDTVLQPHGTIEEPISLRFTSGDLTGGQTHIVDVVSNALANHTLLLCVGASLSDAASPTYLAKWLEKCPRQLIPKIFYICHDKELSQSTSDTLRKLVEARKGTLLTVLFETDADTFLEKLAASCVKRTNAARGQNSTIYHVPPFTSIQIREHLVRRLNGRSTNGYRSAPKPEERALIEVALHALESRGPFSVQDLVSGSAQYYFTTENHRFDRGGALREAIDKLHKCGLLTYFQRVGATLAPCNQKPVLPTVAKHWATVLLSRSESLTPDQFSRLLCYQLEIGGGDDYLMGLVESATMGANAYNVNDCDLPAFFLQGSGAIHSHAEMDRKLDELKQAFELNVKGRQAVRCRIITERGEHLFRPDILNSLVSPSAGGAPLPLEELVRPWLKPIISADKGNQSLEVIVASRPVDLPDGRDRLIQDYMKQLGERPCISVYEMPWQHHDDHMWFYRTLDCAENVGVYFPSPHHTRSFCSVSVNHKLAVDQLERLFEINKVFWSKPIKGPLPIHVVALTIVDDSALHAGRVTMESKVLVGVRRAETNRRHAGIASVPTKRISGVVFRSLLTSCEFDVNGDNTLQIVGRRDEVAQSLTQELVESVMSRKLGLADALERQQLVFKAEPRLVRIGYSPRLNNSDEPEYVRLLNICVFLQDGSQLIPPETASYSSLTWQPASDFVGKLKSPNDSVTVRIGDTEFQYGGVCICTADVLLREMLQRS